MKLNTYHEILSSHFKNVDQIVVLGRGPSALEVQYDQSRDAVLVTDPTYVYRDVFSEDPTAVLIGDSTRLFKQIAERFNSTAHCKHPLLIYTYLPHIKTVDFKKYNLPDPINILPILKESGLYEYEPGRPYPTSGVFLTLIAATLNKNCVVAGIDFYRHPSLIKYVNSSIGQNSNSWGKKHSESTEIRYLNRAKKLLGNKLKIIGIAGETICRDESNF